MTDELGCYDCNRPYAKGPDLLIEQAAWLKIAPHPSGGGVLCPNCIHDRLVAAGFAGGTVLAEFKSGPMASYELITDLKRDTRARRQGAPAMTDEELLRKVSSEVCIYPHELSWETRRAIALCREHYGGEVERLMKQLDKVMSVAIYHLPSDHRTVEACLALYEEIKDQLPEGKIERLRRERDEARAEAYGRGWRAAIRTIEFDAIRALRKEEGDD